MFIIRPDNDCAHVKVILGESVKGRSSFSNVQAGRVMIPDPLVDSRIESRISRLFSSNNSVWSQ